MLHMRYINRTLHVLGHSIYLPVQRIDIITSSQPLRGHQTTYYNDNILIRTQHGNTRKPQLSQTNKNGQTIHYTESQTGILPKNETKE